MRKEFVKKGAVIPPNVALVRQQGREPDQTGALHPGK